ncbi:Histone H2B type 1-K like protein [Argiope bruennichi]|uniref:Histone H2B type 1-K like protein n=1 Tax=Argiope bruennichi TaxID=94029 RepID=A0A8T0G3J9_ARGBR|nr:Histone H2B type 1-K like protein [Argiope bruennichi]
MPGVSTSTGKNTFIRLPRSAERFKKMMNLVSEKIVIKPEESQSKARRRNVLLQHSFKTFVLRVKRRVAPRMAIGSLTLKELDNFIVHMIDLLEDELYTIHRLNNRKTLSFRDMEIAVKLCFPQRLADSSTKFGRQALRSYFKKIIHAKKSVF